MTDETDAQAWALQTFGAAPEPAKSLTIDDIKDAIDRVRAVAPEPRRPIIGWSDVSRFDGVPVYVQRNWPKVQRGTRKRRFPAHPLFLWLARKLGRPAWFELRAPSWSYLEITVPNLVDVDPLIIDGALHCSPAQWEVLRQVVHNTENHSGR